MPDLIHLSAPQRRRALLNSALVAIGLLLVFVAVAAAWIGLDNDPGFGLRRLFLLVVGLLLLLTAARGRLWLAFEARLNPRWPGGTLLFAETGSAPRSTRRTIILLGLIVIPIYLWIFTAGSWTEWPRGSRYFYRLAQGFRAGQLHLLEEPSPQLLAVENPYFHEDRGSVPVIWDALFYEGKYYLYWGPVPGLIVALLQPLSAARIRDPALVITFMAGSYLAGAWLLRAIWQRLPWLPERLFPISVLALSLNAPLVWLLTRPKVYEAAIAGGQFFLLAGLYFAVSARPGTRTGIWKLTAAGLMWGLAANTRVNLALAIFFLGLMVLYAVYAHASSGDARPRLDLAALRSAAFVRPALAFSLPLVLAAAGLMAYNAARFDGPLDFGYRYLITGPTIPEDPSRISSPDYLLPNLYTYFLRPPEIQTDFPYVIVPWIKSDMWPFFIDLPADYFYTEPVASLFLTVPLIGLGLLGCFRWGWLAWNGEFPAGSRMTRDERWFTRWIAIGTAGAAALAVVVLLFFIQNSYRYIVDTTLMALLFAIIVVGWLGYRLRERRWEPWLLQTGFVVAAAATPILAILIGITGYARSFEKLNPELFKTLIRLFP
jgi:hypothetical protein